MGMELKVGISLSDGDMYPNEIGVSRNFEVSLPWAPGNHNAETALVEAIGTIVNFGEVIGELHEELTVKYEEKLAKKVAEESEKLKMAEELGEPMEPSEIETAERQQVPEQTDLVEGQAEAADDTEVPQ